MDKKPLMDVLQQTSNLIEEILKEDDFYYTYSDNLTEGPLDEKRIDLIGKCLDMANLLQRGE